jgi:hypothetical protein
MCKAKKLQSGDLSLSATLSTARPSRRQDPLDGKTLSTARKPKPPTPKRSVQSCGVHSKCKVEAQSTKKSKLRETTRRQPEKKQDREEAGFLALDAGTPPPPPKCKAAIGGKPSNANCEQRPPRSEGVSARGAQSSKQRVEGRELKVESTKQIRQSSMDK